MFLAPMAAMLVQMAISRSREYVADRVGGEICGNPMWLASALANIHNAAPGNPDGKRRAGSRQRPHVHHHPLFGGTIDNLFSTHPNTENRIAELQEQAREMARGGNRSAPPRRTLPDVERPSFRIPDTGPTAKAKPRRRRGPWG